METYQRTSLNHFTARFVDRVAARRRDKAWLDARLANGTTCFIPLWQDKNLFTAGEHPTPVLLAPRHVRELFPQAESVVLLGETEGQVYFAIGLPDGSDAPPAEMAEMGQFRSLRRVAGEIDERDCALLAYAKALTLWHHEHRFCGACGSPTRSAEAGFVRICTNDGCGQLEFPRTDPAIIVLVTRGAHCLLGRKPSWPKGRYSTIAGFVEPGESLEAAVAREVSEETGIAVENVRYYASQPWPFPRSLMLGFTAHATNEAIHTEEEDELEDARWYTREEMRDELLCGTLTLPFTIAISFHLIEQWFDAGDLGPLRKIASGRW